MAKTRKRADALSVGDPSHQSSDTSTPTATLDRESDIADPRDRIAMRAYELYLARGGSDGGDFDDWLAAEREIAGGEANVSKGDAGE
jgi:hypothetical protein